MNHQGQKSHLGGTALVELDGALLEFGVSIQSVPAEIDESVAEIANEFSSGDVLHDSQLKEANEGENLESTSGGDGFAAGPAGRNIRELGSIKGNVTRETDSGGGGQVADNTQHADAAVLDLDVSEAVELVLISVGDNSQWVPEPERLLCTKLALERHAEGRSLGRLLGRSESGGGGNEGGYDGKLHGDCGRPWGWMECETKGVGVVRSVFVVEFVERGGEKKDRKIFHRLKQDLRAWKSFKRENR